MKRFQIRLAQFITTAVFLAVSSIAPAFGASAPPAFLTNGLVAYYPLNGNAHDESGHGANGSINTTTSTADRNGIADKALSFTGGGHTLPISPSGSSLVTLPAASLHLAGSGTATVSLWCLARQTNDAVQFLFQTCPYVYYVPPPSAWGLGITIAEGGRILVLTASDTDRNWSTTSLSTNKWYHVAVVYSGESTSNSNKVRIYINGTRDVVAQVRPEVIPATIPSTANAAFLGAGHFKSTGEFVEFLDGALDDVRIYNRALSDSEVKALYDYESTPPDNIFLTNGLVAYYPFSGDANDAAGAGHSSTLYRSLLTSDRHGKPERAYRFEANEREAIKIEGLAMPPGSTDKALALWFKQSPRVVIDFLHAPLLSIWSGKPTDKCLQFEFWGNSLQVGDGDPGYYKIFTNPEQPMTDCQWHHIAFNLAATGIEAYFDGRLMHWLQSPQSGTNRYNGAFDTLWLGYMNGSCYYDGALDEVRVYNRLLTATEVSDLYQDESAPLTGVPVITVQPESVAVAPASVTALTVEASGARPLSYTWRRNGSVLTHTQSSILTITNVQMFSEGEYTVTISNASGSTTSSVANINVYRATLNPPGLTNGLVAYYPFAGNANDESGNHDHGVVQGATVAADRFANPNRAFSFLAERMQSIEFSGSQIVRGPNVTTFALWFKQSPKVLEAYLHAPLFSIWDGRSNGELFRAEFWGDSLQVGHDLQGYKAFNACPTCPDQVMVDQQWHHLAFVVQPDNLEAYLDSQRIVWSGGMPAVDVGWSLPTGNLLIGSEPGGYYDGSIDEVRVYNRALSPAEVYALYANESVTLPTISSHPSNQVRVVGESSSFSVVATGGALAFQWLFNGTLIPGATKPTLAVPRITTQQAGSYSVVVSNLAGSMISQAATLTVREVPQITAQPQDFIIVAGGAATLSVLASDTYPLSYQWLFNGTAITGAVGASLTLSGVTESQSGSYSVIVGNAWATVESRPAVVLIIVPPRITTQPVAQSIFQGLPGTFSGAATGTAPLIYQWLKGGSIIAGASQPVLSIASVSAADAGSYQLRVSNAAGTVTSAEAVLTVVVPPTIATAPTSQKVIAGQAARLTVTANGSAPLTYQWLKDGTAIAGATSAELAIANAQPANAGTYQVQISNAAGSVSSGSVTLTVIVPPTITTAPATQIVIAGQTARFTVAAAGSSPLTYEWFKDGVRVPGASLSELVLANVQPSNAGSYTVHVTNEGGTVNSSPAVLTVLVPPTITAGRDSKKRTVKRADSVSGF